MKDSKFFKLRFITSIDNTSAYQTIVLYNQLGMKVKELVVYEEKTTIDTSDLASGIYNIHLMQGSIIIEIQKISVSH